MFSDKSRAGAANLGTPLMLASFAAIAGFVYWLSISAEPTAVIVDEPEDVAPGNVVSMGAFSADTKAFMDMEIELRDVPVSTLLGPHAFWTSLTDANQTAYLIHFGQDLITGGAAATAASTVDIIGTVQAMSDSILDAWEAAGAFPGGAGDRFQAEFAEDFLEITSLDEATPAPPS